MGQRKKIMEKSDKEARLYTAIEKPLIGPIATQP
jgi:hypothetical protein